MKAEPRFRFGSNWRSFATGVGPTQVAKAEAALVEMLQTNDLSGIRFLDAGCGSGLSSLAARNLGAEVHAFDFDVESVETARALKEAHRPSDTMWTIEQGDITNLDYRSGLGQFQTVYSWGVLHHTGVLRLAMEAVTELVVPGGTLFVALYNDQGWISRYWAAVKKTYVTHSWTRLLLTGFHVPYLVLLRYLVRLLRGGRTLERGMSYRHDLKDWLGGYPFEVISPQETVDFYGGRGFALKKMCLVGRRHGCNEYVFTRQS